MTMFDRLHQFNVSFDALKPKAQKLFLQGKITLSEAETLSAAPRSLLKRTKAQLAKSHELRHEPLKRECAGIDAAIETIDELNLVLDRMPLHIASAVLDGSMTLIQARFAYLRNFGGQPVRQICRANVPKVLSRLHARPTPSEVSFRKLNSRKRAYLATRAR